MMKQFALNVMLWERGKAPEAKRDDLFEGIRDAEQMKGHVAWDSYMH